MLACRRGLDSITQQLGAQLLAVTEAVLVCLLRQLPCAGILRAPFQDQRSLSENVHARIAQLQDSFSALAMRLCCYY